MTVPKGPEAGPGRQYRMVNGETKVVSRASIENRPWGALKQHLEVKIENGVLRTTFVAIEFASRDSQKLPDNRLRGRQLEGTR